MKMPSNQSIVDMFHAGMAIKDIADALKCVRSTVTRALNKFKETGSARRKPGSGRPRSVRTKALIKSVREKIRRQPVRSMRKMAKEAGVSDFTIRKVVKEDLKAKSRARTKRQLITRNQKEARLERSKKLLQILKRGMPVILFTDEKEFTVDSAPNRRNDRYISRENPKDVPDNVKHTFQTKHPASVMMFGLVSSDGKKMPPVFFKKNEKVTKEVYLKVLKNHVKPWIDSNYTKEANIVFQQDGAPAHTSNLVKNWLEKNIKNFWSKAMWPASSPDLNPLDYSIWAYVEAKACAHPHANTDSLKKSIIKEWTNMSEEYIRTTCSKFRPRLEAVIAAEGGHFE